MISFLTVIFLLVAVLFIVIFNLFDFLLVTYFTGFINNQYFIRQVILFGCKLWYWCWIVYCIIQYFCCFWSWSIFCILSLSQPYTYNTTLLYTDTTFIISTNIDRTTNQLIFQPIKQINQLICPCNIPDQLIYFT